MVSIGCGLDTRFDRLDNGRVEWFELDFPEVIELRRRFFDETDRYHFIASSALDFRWIDDLSKKKSHPFFFYAEGVLMYFREQEARSLILELHSAFPGSSLACHVVNKDIVGLMGSKRASRRFQRKFFVQPGVVFRFGIDRSDDFEQWGPGIKVLDEWTLFDEPEKKPGWFRLCKNIRAYRYAQWLVLLRL